MEEISKPQGLTTKEVEERISKGQINKTSITVGKSYLKIITDNLLSFFNIILFAIAGLMIYGGYYTGLFFLVVLIPNIIIGLYEDITARRLMGKLHVLNAPHAVVIRNGVSSKIPAEEIVLGDIVELAGNDQICADSELVSGGLGVNEALLTGESDVIYKKPGDVLYSASYVVNGKAYARVNKVGNDSYVQSLQSEAKKFKRINSEILSSLKKLFRVIGIVVIIMAIAMLTVYAIQGKFSNVRSFKEVIGPISGSLVAMIPSGLYLLTSVSLATAVINLAKKHAHVQDFYSVEMLARTDVICVDKTGTITDGTMVLDKIDILSKDDENHIKAIIYKVLNATGDNNATAQALMDIAVKGIEEKPTAVLPFMSENKYSGASFRDGTYLIGAPEFINLENKAQILKRIEEYTFKGFRVLVLARSKEQISSKSFKNSCETLAILVLRDHIKDDAKRTFEWFRNNDVNIKVISGDNAITVSEVAKAAGIPNADLFISLEGLSDDQVRDAANKYNVFGRVTPNQKAILVEAIQKAGHTVAMTGDGVNDILALKKADCSIAMASGAEASKNVSHIVLMDSNFASLPAVVAEGRRVVNNLQRTCSLFLVKTMFAVIMTLTFLLASVIARDPKIVYPFATNHLYIWELVCLGIPAFFLALQPNNERIKGKFLVNLSKKSLPAGIAMLLGIFIILGFYLIYKACAIYTGVSSINMAVAMSTLFMSLFAIVVLYKVCSPLDKYRALVLGIAGAVDIGCIIVSYIIYIATGRGNFFKIDFSILSGVNYLITALVILGITVVFLVISYILEVARGERDAKIGGNNK